MNNYNESENAINITEKIENKNKKENENDNNNNNNNGDNNNDNNINIKNKIKKVEFMKKSKYSRFQNICINKKMKLLTFLHIPFIITV